MTTYRLPAEHSMTQERRPSFRLDLMVPDDVPSVGRVERRCFPNPWPASAYRRELQDPVQNHYVVLRAIPAPLDNSDEAASAEQASNGLSPQRSLPRRSLLPLGIGRRHEETQPARSTIIGFAGMWLAFDEAHITTIGVDPDFRGQGLGELLLLSMFDGAIARGSNWLTLEVRVTNVSAQTLYRKYGFTVHGTRKRYYSDNGEDALIMWSRALTDEDVRAELQQHRLALSDRLGSQVIAGEISPFAGAAQ